MKRVTDILSFIIQLVDYRVEFSKWWVTEFKTIKFPSAGTVFDYFIDTETKKFVPWTEKVPKFELDSEMPLQVWCLICFHLEVFGDCLKP